MTDAFGGQGMSSYDAWKWANSQLAQGSNPGLGYISYTVPEVSLLSARTVVSIPALPPAA